MDKPKRCPHCGKDYTVSPEEMESTKKVKALLRKAIKLTRKKVKRG